jgi:ubiquinone biosynthesis protein UbiJ
MLERGAIAALNHLLAQQAWAAERLKIFAGQCAEFRSPPFPDLRVTIRENGLLDRANTGSATSLVVKLKPGALPLLVARSESAFREIEIEGSAEFASTIQHLFRHLTWDVEEDLSRFLGDVLAHRVASQARAFAGWQREAVTRVSENLAEYWTEEQPLFLARPADVAKFCRDADGLGDEVTRLEERIERLENLLKR